MTLDNSLFWWRFLTFVGAGLAAAGAYFSTNIDTKIRKESSKKIEELVGNQNGLLDQNNKLIGQNKELISKVDKYQTDLEKKDEKIKQLEIEAKKANRGISSSYDFNGSKRVTTRPGFISVEAGQEVIVFQNIIKLEEERKYPELIKVCEDQIQKTPDWLTPYLFAGSAYANLGDKENAIIKLEYVLDKAPGDPAYARSSDILKKLKE